MSAPARVRDQSAPLEIARRARDADTAHAEHTRQELVRELELVRLHAIARHEQPARTARFERVEGIGVSTA